MKPAPPEDIQFHDPVYGWVVYSSVDGRRTEIRSPMGKTMWCFDGYIGRREIHLPPDGYKLLLFGSQYFGTTLRVDNAVEILQVVEPDRLPKTIRFDQVFGITIEEAANRKVDMIKGGGWIASEYLCRLESIDWNAGIAVFADAFGSIRTIAI